MPTWDDSCSTTFRERITTAYDGFIDNDALDNLEDLRDEINRRWATVRIVCGDDNNGENCDGVDGRRSSERILICTTLARRIAPLLLHEMVHECGGNELDSEAVEHLVFDGNGASTPFGRDWTKFRRDTTSLNGNIIERVDEFVIWNSNTGEVWVRVDQNGTTSKGTLLFQSDDWIHQYRSLAPETA